MSVTRNHIELRDSSPEGPLHVASFVYIDGNEVLIEKDGFSVEASADAPTVVTLRILPHRVSFN